MAKKAKEKKSAEKSAVKEVTVSESLAVKWRPKKLKDVVGQDHVTSQIAGMIKTGRVPYAFLLEGQTGGGKTTVARMLGRYLNCEKNSACGKCDSCLMGEKTHPDIVTVNAGTEGKVDDIRKLIRGATVAPYYKKRVIIIDEAHKLTGASAEALLIPLEEPSRDTIWVLCTTNPEKMTNTIVNRCVRLTMRPIEPAKIVERLAFIAKAEGHDIGATDAGVEALNLIADFTNGSMREAISLLESVIFAVAGGADITNKSVLTAFIQNSDIDLDKACASLAAALLNRDLRVAIRFVRQSGNIRGLINKLRWLVDHLIAVDTKTSKFKPYTGRLFDAIAEKKGISYSLSSLLELQMAVVDAELKMNSTSIDESVLLQTAIANYAFNLRDTEDEEEERPRKK